MNTSTDSFVTFLILWGIPIALVLRAYIKMNEEERKSARDDFKSKRFIVTIGFMLTGTFLSQAGILFDLLLLKGMGMTLFVLGGIISIKATWKVSKARSAFLILIIAAGMVAVLV